MIRFASIPRCASRSLQSIGLLGEMNGKPHRPITEYPNWERYEWYAVTRDPLDWLRSWWSCGYANPDKKAGDFGMDYMDFSMDMEALHSNKAVWQVPRGGIHGWIPDTFEKDWPFYLGRGLNFYDYCRMVIVGKIPAMEIPLSRLESFLSCKGYALPKMNGRSQEEILIAAGA